MNHVFSPASLISVRKTLLGGGVEGTGSVRSLSSSKIGSAEIDYVRISQELGLHKQSLDFIKAKSQKFIDQITRFKDNSSRIGGPMSVRTDLNSIIAG